MIYLFEMAGLGSYIRGWGIGSKNVQECSFMHKFVQLTIFLFIDKVYCELGRDGL